MEQIGLLCKEIIKNKNMKQLLFLFLFLLPCLAWAQYPSNGNQKITLGEQTTADGLIWRGVLSDTGIITPSSDTSAYIILDTVNNRFFHYKRNTNVWSIAGGSDTSLIAYVNTYDNQIVNGAKTFTSSLTTTKLNVTDSIQANTGVYKINTTTVGLNVDNTTPFRVTIGGNWGIYNDNPQNLLNLFSSSARGGVISNAYPILMFNEVGQSRFLFGLDANEAYLWGQANVKLRIATNNTEKLRIETNGNVGIGQTTPTAVLHLKAGTATASTAPLKFTSQGASLLNPVEPGAVEFNGTNLLFTPSAIRHTVNHGLVFTATLDFASTNAQSSNDQTIAATGAALGDVVSIGVPNASVNANTSYSAWVSAAGTVTVRFNNYSSGTVDPASGLFKVFVTK
jgi:hypothetical protein